MARGELEVSIEVGTGVLPGGKLKASLRRTWERRADAFIDEIATASGLDNTQLEAALLADDRLADTFAAGCERIVRIGDVFYRAALGRLVAAALNGDVAIDRAEELIDQLIGLDPTCVRVLAAVYDGLRRNQGRRAVALEALARDVASKDDVDSAFSRLAAGGFLELAYDVEVELPEDKGDYPQATVTSGYDTTERGRWAYAVCLQHLTVERQNDDAAAP